MPGNSTAAAGAGALSRNLGKCIVGLACELLPKGMDPSNATHQQINAIEHILNHLSRNKN